MIEKFSEFEFNNPEKHKENKNEENQNKISRRNFLKIAAVTAATTVLSGIDKPVEALGGFGDRNEEKESAKSIKWHENSLIKENKWIKNEIISFLEQEEVEKVLGFNPVNSEIKSNLRIEEASIANDNGYTKNNSISINGIFFTGSDPRDYLLNHFFTVEDFKKPHFKKALELYNKIISYKEVLKLYRNLLVVHEYSHIGELHKKGKANHEITNRKEIQLLGQLYQAKKISDDLFEKIFSIYADYYNENESEEEINKYKEEIKKNIK